MVFNRRKIAFFLTGLVLIGLSLACGVEGAAPAASPPPEAAPAATEPVSQPTEASAPQATQPAITALPLVIMPTATAVGSGQPIPAAPPPAIPESRRLTLEYPPRIRTGDSDRIRLTLEVNDLGEITPTAEVQGNTVTGQVVQVPNLYETHHVVAEARLDLAGLEVRPPNAIDEPLLPGQSVTFYWSVRPTESGTYRGTVWFYLRFVDKVSGEQSRRAIAAQTVQIEATKFLGLGGGVARAAGGVGSLIGGVLGFPFIDDVMKWIWNRLRRR